MYQKIAFEYNETSLNYGNYVTSKLIQIKTKEYNQWNKKQNPYTDKISLKENINSK